VPASAGESRGVAPRVGFGALVLAIGIAAALILGVSAEPATFGVAALADAPVCTSDGVCATRSHRPDPVGASTAAQARHVAHDNSFTNGSGNKLSNVTFTEPIPSGFTFVKDTFGVCTATPTLVTCLYGLVQDGQTVANTLVYRTPVLALGSEQTTTFAGTWCWDGCNAHDPGAARVDSLDVPEPTVVRAVAGFDATYLLAGTAAALATGAAASDTDTLAGTWTIPGQASDLAATAEEQPNPPGFQACPADGKTCRSGAWFTAASPGTTSFTPYSTVVYTQDRSLIPRGTTASNYEVAYTPCFPGEDPAHPDGCPVVRLPRCASAADLRCTEFVTKLPGGSFRVGVRIGSHNGHMM
jgi:hypothetical protein